MAAYYAGICGIFYIFWSIFCDDSTDEAACVTDLWFTSLVPSQAWGILFIFWPDYQFRCCMGDQIRKLCLDSLTNFHWKQVVLDIWPGQLLTSFSDCFIQNLLHIRNDLSEHAHDLPELPELDPNETVKSAPLLLQSQFRILRTSYHVHCFAQNPIPTWILKEWKN